MAEWIPTTKYLPPFGKQVLLRIYDNSVELAIGCLSKDNGFRASGESRNVTHWMDIPDMVIGD